MNNENNCITGMSPSENGYGHNDVLDQPHQIMEEQPLQFSAMVFESHDKFVGGKLMKMMKRSLSPRSMKKFLQVLMFH